MAEQVRSESPPGHRSDRDAPDA